MDRGTVRTDAFERIVLESAALGAKTGTVVGNTIAAMPGVSSKEAVPTAALTGAVVGSYAGLAIGLVVAPVIAAVANTHSAKHYATNRGRPDTYQFGDGVKGALAYAWEACEAQ